MNRAEYWWHSSGSYILCSTSYNGTILLLEKH